MIPKKLEIVIPSGYTNNKVSAIKALRELTSLGLKEAKDLSEKSGRQVVDVNPYNRVDFHGQHLSPDANYKAILADLESAGIQVCGEVATAREELLEQVRMLASTSVLRSDFELAQELIRVLRAFS